MSTVAQISLKCIFIEKIIIHKIFLKNVKSSTAFPALICPFFLQAFRNTGIIQFHGIMECRNKVAKCRTTPLELFISCRLTCENIQYSRKKLNKFVERLETEDLQPRYDVQYYACLPLPLCSWMLKTTFKNMWNFKTLWAA